MSTQLKVADLKDAPPPVESADLLQFMHDDNSAVTELFFQFSQNEDDDARLELFQEIERGLTVHAQLASDVLHPLLIEAAGDDAEELEETEKCIAVAEAGARVISQLLKETAKLDADEDEFEANVSILCELTKLQVKKEEKDFFGKLRAADIDLEEPGQEALELKEDLTAKVRKSSKAKPAKSRSSKSKPSKSNPSKSKPASAKSKPTRPASKKSSSAKSKKATGAAKRGK